MHGKMTRVGRRASLVGRIAVLCVLSAVAGFGCRSSGGSNGGSGTPFVSQGDARIRVEVENIGYWNATLYAIWPGRRLRLGTVTGTRTSNFVLPWDRSLEFRVEIDLLAGPSCLTREIWADPGDIIVLGLTNQIMQDPDCLPLGRE